MSRVGLVVVFLALASGRAGAETLVDGPTTTSTTTTSTPSTTTTSTTTSSTTSTSTPSTTTTSTTSTTIDEAPTTTPVPTTAPPTTTATSTPVSVLGATASTCPSGSYTNVDGNRVCSPTTSAGAGATARCEDGTFSYSQNRRGTCSGHGGVAQWLGGSGGTAVTTSVRGTSETAPGGVLAQTGTQAAAAAAVGAGLLSAGLVIRRRGAIGVADHDWRKRQREARELEERRRQAERDRWHW